MSPNDRAHITATAQNVQVIAPIYFYAFIALFRYRSIRVQSRPISLSLNTGSVAPYFAIAQYGLIWRLCAHFVARIRRQLRYCPHWGQYATRLRLCARANALCA